MRNDRSRIVSWIGDEEEGQGLMKGEDEDVEESSNDGDG